MRRSVVSRDPIGPCRKSEQQKKKPNIIEFSFRQTKRAIRQNNGLSDTRYILRFPSLLFFVFSITDCWHQCYWKWIKARWVVFTRTLPPFLPLPPTPSSAKNSQKSWNQFFSAPTRKATLFTVLAHKSRLWTNQNAFNFRNIWTFFVTFREKWWNRTKSWCVLVCSEDTVAHRKRLCHVETVDLFFFLPTKTRSTKTKSIESVILFMKFALPWISSS